MVSELETGLVAGLDWNAQNQAAWLLLRFSFCFRVV